MEWNRKDTCIKKIGKIREKTLLQRVPPFIIESPLYSLKFTILNDTLSNSITSLFIQDKS